MSFSHSAPCRRHLTWSALHSCFTFSVTSAGFVWWKIRLLVLANKVSDNITSLRLWYSSSKSENEFFWFVCLCRIQRFFFILIVLSSAALVQYLSFFVLHRFWNRFIMVHRKKIFGEIIFGSDGAPKILDQSWRQKYRRTKQQRFGTWVYCNSKMVLISSRLLCGQNLRSHGELMPWSLEILHPFAD